MFVYKRNDLSAETIISSFALYGQKRLSHHSSFCSPFDCTSATMLIREYRIVMPLTIEEYQIGQLFSVTEASRQETGGGEGVQVVRNEPFEGQSLFNGRFTSGQFTHKIIHLDTKVPAFLRAIMPRGSTTLHERSWNAFPYCKTEVTNPDYMKDDFLIRIETMHLSDRGTTKNALDLSRDVLNERKVVRIDIANDNEFLNAADILDNTRPSTFRSVNTGRGPLEQQWQTNCEPVMCAYKVVTVKFKWFGLQTMVESSMQKSFPRLFCKFNREVFCWMDRWYGLTLAQIRLIEEETKKALDEMRATGKPRGMTGN
ncbi:hypothetical protein niasHS_016097 [Heterodera schachtii]|uniref:Phosphatidylinositol transfer protein N-terminal domain-containing protein n=1 Tax=Heterodera schachtii TaxID=97005 RepID=A0ABD2HZ62_HETSC